MPIESLRQHGAPSALRQRAAVSNRRSRLPSSAKAGAGASCGAGIRIVKRIHHRWTEVFRLVLDVERYPAFVPHCQDVHLLSRTTGGQGSTIIVSRMSVGLAALHVDYVTRTVGDLRSRRIDINAIDGPLRYLRAVWKFEPDADWTEIEFTANYQFSNPILAALAARVLESMFTEVINAFEQRADRLAVRARANDAPRDRLGSASVPVTRGFRAPTRN